MIKKLFFLVFCCLLTRCANETNNTTHEIFTNSDNNSLFIKKPERFLSFSNKTIAENETKPEINIKDTVKEIILRIKTCFFLIENDLVKRCIIVLMLVIITIVLCCLSLQVMISLTKNCKLALNEIANRERKMAFENRY